MKYDFKEAEFVKPMDDIDATEDIELIRLNGVESARNILDRKSVV